MCRPSPVHACSPMQEQCSTVFGNARLYILAWHVCTAGGKIDCYLETSAGRTLIGSGTIQLLKDKPRSISSFSVPITITLVVSPGVPVKPC